MNQYSFLEKVLHKLALSPQLIREVTFDVESSVISPFNSTEKHVFISGLARSGTTILLNSLYKSKIFASLTYADMPFVLAPNLWSKISFKQNAVNLKERAHGDGIKFSIKSPEAFEEVFWKTFPEDETESFDNFRIYINIILKKYNAKRYLSKNNQNIRRIFHISKFFPDSIIFIPFREPMQHAYSLLTQHKKFIEYSRNDKFIPKYMKWIGHTEFGPNYIPIHYKNLLFENDLDINHWLEQWYFVYQNCMEKLIDTKNINFISYKKLCTSKDYWLDILKILNIEETYEFNFNESQKQINLEVNNQLYEKSLSLYSELEKLSIIKL